jgi:hypothetical protein
MGEIMANTVDKLDVKNLLLSSSTDLTLSDRRLYNYLLLNAIDELPKRLNFKLSLTELQGVYGIGQPPIDRVKESLRRLIRTIIEFESKSKDWIITSLLERAELKKDIIYYSYPHYCRELFSSPVTLEKCLIQAHFIQKYSSLLYDVLSEAHYLGQDTLSLPTSDLRSRLHVGEKKMTNYSDFDRFILTPASNEINSYASFAVKFHTIRKGMKVTDVVFTMTTKRNILNIDVAKNVIPIKRPRFFIDDPELERSYAYLLNAETKERRKFFDMAVKLAKKKKKTVNEEEFDRPDLWFNWIKDAVLKKQK